MTELVSVGYGGRDPDEFVEALVKAGVQTVVDVRVSPRSRMPAWSKSALSKRLAESGIRYRHVRDLGNANLKAPEGTPPKLVNAEAGIEALQEEMARGRVAILCVCRQPTGCHRQLVIEHLRRNVPSLEVRDL